LERPNGFGCQTLAEMSGSLVASGYVNSLLLNMAIEIVSFPIENGDFR
jgi:hypothetical protein